MQRKWIIAIGFGVGVFVTVLVLHPPLTSQDWAGWMQAVFSVGAIWFAVRTGRAQHIETERQSKNGQLYSDMRHAQAIQAIVHPILLITGHILPSIHTRTESAITLAGLPTFDDHRMFLESLPLFEIPDRQLIVLVTTTTRAIEIFTSACRSALPIFKIDAEYGMADPQNGGVHEDVHEAAKKMRATTDNMYEKLNLLTDRCSAFIAECENKIC